MRYRFASTACHVDQTTSRQANQIHRPEYSLCDWLLVPVDRQPKQRFPIQTDRSLHQADSVSSEQCVPLHYWLVD